MEPFEIWVSAAWNSSGAIPSAPASLVGRRAMKPASSSADFSSICRARAHRAGDPAERARSSSMIAPLMRVAA